MISGEELAESPTPDGVRRFVAQALAANPDLLSSALHGITEGMSLAIRQAKARASNADQATLAAMALCQGRVGKDLRETLLARVVANIHPVNQCGYERGYIDNYRSATGDQTHD